MKRRGYSFWVWLCIALCLSTVAAYGAPYPVSTNSIAHFDQIQAKIHTPTAGVLYENNVDFSFLTDVESVKPNWDKTTFGHAINRCVEDDLKVTLFRRFKGAIPQSKFLILIFPFHSFW